MNFLVGYNGSHEAKSALSLARDFAKIFDAKTQKMLLGSTAQYVILKAPCPVITVK